jgi:hypothetical protein
MLEHDMGICNGNLRAPTGLVDVPGKRCGDRYCNRIHVFD